ncbi:MAG: gamma-glutamyl-gamma-aminobutyrate hydrolase family protein [Alphaproteobacteria bacterium]|jgi:putative glutamine amidotransferase
MVFSGPLPLVGVPADVREIGIHPFHAVGEKYINAIAHASGALPLLIPAFGEGRDLAPLSDRFDLDAVVERLDGLFLTGSPSNVMPHRYDGPDSEPGTLHDEQRDFLTLPLIHTAVDAGLPLFAVCRGIQEVNVAYGGTLHQRIQDVPEMMDHREDKEKPRDEQYGPAHKIALAEGGLLAGLAGGPEAMVNSLHSQGVDRLAPGLIAEATAPDGIVEALRVANASAFTLAVQWHPEWRVHENPLSLAMFEAFGDAVRARAAARGPRSERVA